MAQSGSAPALGAKPKAPFNPLKTNKKSFAGADLVGLGLSLGFPKIRLVSPIISLR